MKFLEIPALQNISIYLSGLQSASNESIIYGKLEAYSCKRAGSDKKLYKNLETQYQVELSKSPDSKFGTSPFGPLSESSSRKTFISLISLLNVAFPDYDFSKAKAEHFRKELGPYMIINSINTILANVVPNYNTDLGTKLWSTLDTEISLKECDIYTYVPDVDSDPYAEDGTLWNFNYFFYNKKLKRILYFTCYAVSKLDTKNITMKL